MAIFSEVLPNVGERIGRPSTWLGGSQRNDRTTLSGSATRNVRLPNLGANICRLQSPAIPRGSSHWWGNESMQLTQSSRVSVSPSRRQSERPPGNIDGERLSGRGAGNDWSFVGSLPAASSTTGNWRVQKPQGPAPNFSRGAAMIHQSQRQVGGGMLHTAHSQFRAISPRQTSFSPRTSAVRRTPDDSMPLSSSPIQQTNQSSDEAAHDKMHTVSSSIASWENKYKLPWSGLFACALIAKCGSLDRAFERLDFNSTQKVCRTAWDAALNNLHIDTMVICDRPAKKIFLSMSSRGEVTLQSWNKFFKAFLEDPASAAAIADAVALFKEHEEIDHRHIEQGSLAEHAHNRPNRPSDGHESQETDESAPSLVELEPHAGRHGRLVHHANGAGSHLEQLDDIKAGDRQAHIDDLHLQALAEAEQLEEEIAALDLKGIEALAHVFLAKMGSLEKAFKWFDNNNRHQISNNQWDTGIMLLRIDVEKLTGFDTRHWFSAMESGSHTGVLSQERWKEFFADVDQEDLFKRIAEKGFAGSLADRAEHRKKQLHQAIESEIVERLSAVGDGHSAAKKHRQHSKDGKANRSTDRKRASINEELTVTIEGDADTCSSDRGQTSRKRESGDTTASEGRPVGARNCSGDEHDQLNRIASHERLEGDQTYEVSTLSEGSESIQRRTLRLDYLDDEELDFRRQVYERLSRLEDGEFKEYGASIGDRKVMIVEDVAQELDLWSHLLSDQMLLRRSYSRGGLEAAGGILVGKIAEFASDVNLQLLSIDEGGCYEFPVGQLAAHRRVIHLIANDYGMQTISDGSGDERRAIVFNFGDFSKHIREQLESIEPGESKAFSSEYSEYQRRLIHLISAELGLWSYSEGVDSERYVEVFNLADFSKQVREKLTSLMPGEEYSFDTHLTEKQRRVVHCIAHELNLVSLSRAQNEERRVTVANLGEFRAWARDELDKLGPGARKHFEGSLTEMQCKVIENLTTELGMYFFSQGAGENQLIIVSRDGSIGNTDPSQRAPPAAIIALVGSMDDEEMSMISRIFDQYATGRFKGHKILLRFPDLPRFAEELAELMPQKVKQFQKFCDALEFVFEETVQLQLDFGTHTSKGLTLQWFQVFIHKAARRVGWSIIGLLFAMLEHVA